jgi:prevent-host-death family protein
MTKLGATQFKASCLAVLERVRRTGERVVITRRGKPIAQLLPLSTGAGEAPQKSLLGSVEIVGDIIGPVVPRSAWNALGETRVATRRKRSR